MRFPVGPMIGLLYECCPRWARRIPCRRTFYHDDSPHSLPRSEAHRAPDIVDGDLADALDVLLQQVPPEDVPIQIRAKLPRFGICDPAKAVRLRGFYDRTAPLVDIGERLDEDKDCVRLRR